MPASALHKVALRVHGSHVLSTSRLAFLRAVAHEEGDLEREPRTAGAGMAPRARAVGRRMTSTSLAGWWGREAEDAGDVDESDGCSDVPQCSCDLCGRQYLDAGVLCPAAGIARYNTACAAIFNPGTRASVVFSRLDAAPPSCEESVHER